MLSTATSRVEVDFGRNRLLHTIMTYYAAVWIVTAVRPVDRADWVLENLLVVSLVVALAGTYRVLPLSDLSYLLIAGFLTLHAVGAHYTYAKVPLGAWAQEVFGHERNHYDRLAHFAFGLLLAYPIREVFLRVASARGFWAYYLPLDVTLATSAVYELIEWIAAAVIAPDLGAAYLGSQGDQWDAQKDMLAAGLGAAVSMSLTAFLSTKRRRA